MKASDQLAVQDGVPVERVVLLSEDGRAIGIAPKATVHTKTTPLHLAFSCYVFDQDRRLLLTQRAWAKATWPGVWTNTCCGHPEPGETLADAVTRRLATELGLAARELTAVLPDFRYRAVMNNGIVENEICPVFRARIDADTPLHLDPSEIADSRWLPWTRFVRVAVNSSSELSPWSQQQARRLAAIGPDPLTWPAAHVDPQLGG